MAPRREIRLREKIHLLGWNEIILRSEVGQHVAQSVEREAQRLFVLLPVAPPALRFALLFRC